VVTLDVVDRFGNRRASTPALLGFVLALTGLMSCGSSTPLTPDDSVDASTYTAVIGHFVPPPSLDPEMLPVVYVAGLGATEMSLEDQVSVIDSFATTHEVRFVDDFAAAVDEDSPGAPPRDEGVLIGVGRISPDSPHNVRVEVYVDVDRVEAQLVTVAYRRGVWVIEGVEPVEPEVLVGDE
jgi:hypothetical protein